MGKSKIEWAAHVWNPVTGCTKISPGCQKRNHGLETYGFHISELNVQYVNAFTGERRGSLV